MSYPLATHLIIAEVIGCILGMTTTGCTSHSRFTSQLPKSARRVALIQPALDKAFAENEELFFLSWDGRWGGTDDDCLFVLKPDGKVTLVHYGNAIMKYEGEYTIVEAENGGSQGLLFSPWDSEMDWPIMAMYTDDAELVIIPASPVDPAVRGDHWLYRQIPRPMEVPPAWQQEWP